MRPIFPKLTYSFNAIHIKIPDCLAEVDKLILKFIRNCKGLRTAKIILKKLDDSHFSILKLTIICFGTQDSVVLA